jgi:hypothetical protein
MHQIYTKLIILFLGIISFTEAMAACPRSKEFCELIYTRPWSKDLGSQCTMMYYHCTKKTCSETKTWSEKRKRCDPIKCKPYEIYDYKLKCCIKSNRKLKVYNKKLGNPYVGKPYVGKEILYIQPKISLPSFEKRAGGELIYINDKNRRHCRNSKAKDGEICLMTYQNAKYYCEKKGGNLPSVKNFLRLSKSKERWRTDKWTSLRIHTISPSDIYGRDFNYEYDENIKVNIVVSKKKTLAIIHSEKNRSYDEYFHGLDYGIWVNEYCYNITSERQDKDGTPLISTCKYFPTKGTYEYGYPSLATAPVICEQKDFYTKANGFMYEDYKARKDEAFFDAI